MKKPHGDSPARGRSDALGGGPAGPLLASDDLGQGAFGHASAPAELSQRFIGRREVCAQRVHASMLRITKLLSTVSVSIYANDRRRGSLHNGGMSKPHHFVREWRKHRELNQQQLGDRVGMSKGNVSKIENGHQRLSVDQLSIFAEALNCDPADLLRPPAMQGLALFQLIQSLPDAEKQKAEDIIKVMATHAAG